MTLINLQWTNFFILPLFKLIPMSQLLFDIEPIKKQKSLIYPYTGLHIIAVELWNPVTSTLCIVQLDWRQWAIRSLGDIRDITNYQPPTAFGVILLLIYLSRSHRVVRNILKKRKVFLTQKIIIGKKCASISFQ